jgi:hypothetical protein
MAADDGSPISSDKLRQVLERLNDVLAEAARLRKEVIRQLASDRASQQQHLSGGGGRKRKTKAPARARSR